MIEIINVNFFLTLTPNKYTKQTKTYPVFSKFYIQSS